MPRGRTDEVGKCQYCHTVYKIQGLKSHERACKIRKDREARDAEYEQRLIEQEKQEDSRRKGIIRYIYIYCSIFVTII